MLGLASTTDPRWVEVALADLDAVLLDHLHCELKAASNATAMVTRYPMHPRLARELTALAAEELGHVAQVFEALALRGVAATPPPEDVYARSLQRALADKRCEPLLDRLAVASVIEARSCERFGLLAAHAPTEAMRGWYRELFASEARHHRLFASLAEEIFGEERARERIGFLVQREAEILSRSAPAPRVH
jgi:tRNA-(ms[2]io[6]A)-hydroxylase